MLRLLIVSILAVAPILAQDTDSDRLRALTEAAPQLPVDRIQLEVNPPMTLERRVATPSSWSTKRAT